jgi:hypothetical protein
LLGSPSDVGSTAEVRERAAWVERILEAEFFGLCGTVP